MAKVRFGDVCDLSSDYKSKFLKALSVNFLLMTQNRIIYLVSALSFFAGMALLRSELLALGQIGALKVSVFI